MPVYLRRPLWACLQFIPKAAPTVAAQLSSVRYASLTSAIGRGIRKSRSAEASARGRRDDKSEPRNTGNRHGIRRNDAWKPELELDEDEFIKTGKFRGLPSQHQKGRREERSRHIMNPEEELPSQRQKGRKEERSRHIMNPEEEYPLKVNPHHNKRRRGKDHEYSDRAPERVKGHVQIPSSVPYTTPASEFIYGTSAVQAALRCSRRKLYKLYLYQAEGEDLSAEKVAIRKLALSKNIQVKMAFAEWDRLLDKMSAGRPHNGCILEASPLPKLPVTGLEPVNSPLDDHFRASLGPQSREEAVVNGTDNRIPVVGRLRAPAADPEVAESTSPRYPFVILLDGILDPGNMGAIIRSAYYLGVDAIVLTGRNSAPLSPVAIKASAGAAENMTLLKANSEMDFIRRSRANGWRFYAADAPGNVDQLAASNGSIINTNNNNSSNSSNNSILTNAPTVLMFGSEGTGLMPRVKAQADGLVSIPGARIRPELHLDDPARVDSLNVSVAAALLMEMFLRVPLRVLDLSPLSHPNPAASRMEEEESPDKQAPRTFDFN